jgi:micrococcal nuclease
MRDIRHSFILALMLLLLTLAMPVRAADEDVTSTTPQELVIIDRGRVDEILRSDMIMLDDNRRYRLDNIRVPPYEDPPAREELEHTFLNTNVIVYTYHNVEDDDEKHTVPLAHIVTEKGVWMQQDLISKGLAWAYSTESSQQTVGILKQAEEKARVQHKGFWGNPAYAIKSPESVKDYVNSYQIVEGRILSVVVKANSGIVFFNFGKDWRHDFTVQFRANHFLTFMEDPTTGERTNAGVARWRGKLVRVRGWVTKEETGPTMVLTHKEQIDILPMNGQ